MVTHSDLNIIFNMFERYPIHLRHLFADLIAHQGQYAHLGMIFVGPYITLLIRGMGLLERTRTMDVIGDMAPLGTSTLLSIGLMEL